MSDESKRAITEGRANLCTILAFSLDPFNRATEAERQETRSCPPAWRVIEGGRARRRAPGPDGGRPAA
jgi:hypothetical protein